MAEREQNGIVENEMLLRDVNNSKLWRATITCILNRHETKMLIQITLRCADVGGKIKHTEFGSL